MADTHFASQIHLLLGTLYFKVAWYTLLPNSLCSSTHSTPWHTLLLSTLCFRGHFAFCVPDSKVCCREILQRSKMFQGAKCSKEQSIPGSKMCWEAKYFRKQSVPGIKMCWGAKCSEEQSMSLQSMPRSKVFWGAKCVSASSSSLWISYRLWRFL